MNKGTQLKTISGHYVSIEFMSNDANLSHPITGWIWNRYSNEGWSKLVWTIEGFVIKNQPNNYLNLIL